MSLDASSLRKVLQLEAEKGCHDSAVIGGLDRFLNSCFAGPSDLAGRFTQDKNLRQHFLLKSGYAALDLKQRADWVNKALSLLEEPGGIKAAGGSRTETAAKLPPKPIAFKHILHSPAETTKHLKLSKTEIPNLTLEAEITALRAERERLIQHIDTGVSLIKEGFQEREDTPETSEYYQGWNRRIDRWLTAFDSFND